MCEAPAKLERTSPVVIFRFPESRVSRRVREGVAGAYISERRCISALARDVGGDHEDSAKILCCGRREGETFLQC